MIRFFCPSMLMIFFPGVLSVAAEDEPVLPEPLGEEAFAELRENSPFLRMLSVKDTWALRGVARIGEHTYITLQHRKTEKIITISSEEENGLGMSLIAVSGSNPADMAVKISFGGSEFDFAYEQAILQPKKSAPGTRDTIRKDREGRTVTTDELVKKWHSLSEDQRRAYDRWKAHLLQVRPELRFSEKRFPIAHKALDAFKSGKPPPPIKR